MKIRTKIAMGLGVLTACATVSCNDYDVVDSGAINYKKTVAEYETNFIDRYGQPDPNHTWGFGAPKAITRGVNANANQWYYTYEVDPNIADDERAGVYAYVNKDAGELTKVSQPNWTEFFVTQVWKGDAEGSTTPLTESYKNQDGKTEKVAGGSKMDKMSCQWADGTWEHAYNFNDSGNGNDVTFEGDKSVKIIEKMLMTNSGTKSFRYQNSQGDHLSEKYIVVSGKDIFGEDSKYAGYYYVCFDFEFQYTDEEKAAEVTNTVISGSYQKKVVTGGDMQINFSIEMSSSEVEAAQADIVAFLNKNNNKYLWVNGDYTLDAKDIKNLKVETSPGSWGIVLTVTGTLATGEEPTESWETVYLNNENFNPNGFYTEEELTADKILELKGETAEVDNVNITVKIKGYQNGDKHFDGDNNYSDWIVRISPAVLKPNNTKRIFCEDLGNTSDFDFNDVVFDATWSEETKNQVTIQLRAAGGTLPIYVGGVGYPEAHSQFGVESNKPVNVNASDGFDGKSAEAYVVTLDKAYDTADEAFMNIIITVKGQQGTYDLKTVYKADDSNVPQIFAVPDQTMQWTKEHVLIETAYPEFPLWVENQEQNTNWHNNHKVPGLLY